MLNRPTGTLLLGGIAGLLLSGCSGPVSLNYHEADRPRPAVREIHVVDVDRCHHHAGCGHEHRDGRWVVIQRRPAVREVHVHQAPQPREIHVHEAPRPTRVHREPTVHVEVEHVHDDSCGCAWSHGSWIKISKGHRHRPGCGHFYIEGRWTIR